MKIIITEEQKKKLFIPRKQSGPDSKWNDWNKEQPIIDGEPINQYDNKGRKQGYWEEYFDNGSIEMKVNYKNDQYHGYCEFFWMNGNIQSEGTYINGIQYHNF